MKNVRESFGSFFSKGDAEIIFSMDKREWEVYVQQIIFPEEWKVRLFNHDTGTGIVGLNETNIYGMSIQPLYPNEDSMPDMIIVGHYYADGMFPAFTDELKEQVEEVIMNGLEPDYSVRISYPSMPPYSIVEITVTRF